MEDACMDDNTEKTPDVTTSPAPAVAVTPKDAAEKEAELTAQDRAVKFALGVGKELGTGLLVQATRKLNSAHVELLCAGLNSAGFRGVSHKIHRFRTYGR